MHMRICSQHFIFIVFFITTLFGFTSAGFWNYFLSGGGSSLSNTQATGGVSYVVPITNKMSATVYGQTGISSRGISAPTISLGVNRQVGSGTSIGGYISHNLADSILKFLKFKR